jgi:hypothetical protein
MILQSRKWRLLLRGVVLALASALMLAFAAPASYALQDDRPKLITSAEQLYDPDKPVADTYIYTSALPDLARMVTTQGINTTYHWIALPAYGNHLLIRTEGDSFLHGYYRNMDLNMITQPVEGNFYGKVTPLKNQAGSEEVVKELADKGIEVDKDKVMVILQGEEPSTYRPMVPIVGVLAVFWILALVGLLRIVSGRRNPRRRKA